MKKKAAGFLINLMLLLILIGLLAFMIFSVLQQSNFISGHLISQIDNLIGSNRTLP